MKISAVITYLESLAHPSLQEPYDNAGLITGDASWECSGIICTLDSTEDVIQEAIAKKCNLIVAHHPIIFGGLKKINGKNYVEKTIIIPTWIMWRKESMGALRSLSGCSK
jgi:putative NIF3 family GTP cyclohydrolase 1 type 2